MSDPTGPNALAPFAEASRANIHGSCVAIGRAALLIVGRSGSGKSALALEMIALGAELVADDRVELARDRARVLASAPEPIAGVIEARGIGLLRAAPFGPAPLSYILDLDRPEAARLPAQVEMVLLGCRLPLLGAPNAPNLAAALVQLLKAGRVPPEWPNR
ncbi:HPr kinase/phosphatase C-terminal domain-containing protein [Ruegeria sp. 2012CJ41-6]|uniref:HPr kinase/phosphatase C-terminal domain-containing protein n=1 Tax=Ruegeria spongiae TaxID=2942209 RepID=A0ABT0Q3P4_9RHOB|nr:HPr kinase/phosphatase C-terminal domain-containing protein [Ruegeria spongiae]MCL6284483.1 HPr kinase/phosphatase C-terminal domain-containing protein [Ruegeria spongiae]